MHECHAHTNNDGKLLLVLHATDMITKHTCMQTRKMRWLLHYKGKPKPLAFNLYAGCFIIRGSLSPLPLLLHYKGKPKPSRCG